MALTDPVNNQDIQSVKIPSATDSKESLLGGGGQEAVTNLEEHNANNPQMPDGTAMPYQNIQANNNEFLNRSDIPLAYETSGGSGSAEQASASQGQTSLINNPDIAGATGYNATQADFAQADTFQMNPYAGDVTAAQGEVDPRSLIDYQYQQLLNGHKDENGTPDWARTAVAASNQRMASLGLGASTMAGGASTAAILNAALPMAQFNSTLFSEINKINLSNRQQAAIATAGNRLQAGMANLSAATNTAIANMQSRQQTLLENAKMDNAAKQYNATNEQQNNQFRSSLITSIATKNAEMANAMTTFNVGEANKTSMFNAGEKNKNQEFYDNLRDTQQKFNIENAKIIAQSNVQWRRTINTANTAGRNSVAQADAQNRWNLSMQAQQNLWQQARDEASWALTSSENSKNRTLSLVNSSLNRQTSLEILQSQMNSQLYGQLGGLAANVLGSVFKGSGTDLFGFGGGSSSGGGGGDFGGGGTDLGVADTGFLT